MEEESLEYTHEESFVLETDTLMENTKTLEGPADAEQVMEEETEEPEAPNNPEAVEEDKAEQLLTEDTSVPETSEQQTGEIQIEQHLITEEDPLMNETLEDTEGPETEPSLEDSEDEEEEEEDEENSLPAPEPENERSISPPEEPQAHTEDEEVDPSIIKEKMELLHKLQSENEKLNKINQQLQTRIAEHFSKKKGDQHVKLDEDISEQEQYEKYMQLIADMKEQQLHFSKLHQERMEDLHLQSSEKLKQVEQELRFFAALKYETVMKASLTGKVGKQETLAKVELLKAEELKQEDKLVCVRLNNIKLKNKISKYERALRSKRELVDGLLLMDFEQLKTENQSFMDKLEERSEELHRLKKKVASSVQGISHVKEKLHFMQMENKAKHTQLAQTDTLVALKREVLTRTRQVRDGLRTDNLKLQQRSGLMGNTTLLQDYEEKMDTSENLQQKLEMLKKHHAELSMKCAGVQRKIKDSRLERQ
ncbi:cilia- and flagella-associated protein 184 [Danio rerio]|uniref:Coiled-coil domain-containing 96 n=1 Tax=Danio rerio TaxID=7955 RepID=B3DID5_DANRE|nr:coiled-coil domain-containing protein 96 [Danio rerio]AAI63089.1 Similar to coiled-coil domain containing 96 [Danio rerio]AAI63104.1 Similar to coiled-coil domain containing 96 [Danio rerio]|eukprot:NP_001122170.1 coiled-coil domain-containing protein 96 [Danio rerio]